MTGITLLPNGKQQFFSAAGVPLAGGTVQFFQVGGSVPKDTWQDPAKSILNTNPVILDSAGEALLYGYGAYRQLVKDSVGNTIWDQQTQDTSELIQDGQLLWAGTTTGPANTYNFTLVPPITAYFAGQRFLALAHQGNTGAVIVNVSALGNQNLLKPSGAGPVPLVGAEIATNNLLEIGYDGSQFQLLSVSAGAGTAASVGGFPWAIAAGTADAITATYSPANTSLPDGLGLAFRAAHANVTTTPTFSPDGFTPHVIKKKGGAPLAAGDIAGALAEYLVRYNLANTRWELLNPSTTSAGTGGITGLRNITIVNNPGLESTQVLLTGSNITLQDGMGNTAAISSFSTTINNLASGAGGVDTGSVAASSAYYLYIIYNGTTVAGLMSLSASTPTLPSGYTFFARVSFQVTDSAKHFLLISQVNDTAQYIVRSLTNSPNLPPIITGVQGNPSTPVWVAASLVGIIPSTAVRVRITLRAAAGAPATIAAPNNSYGSWLDTGNPPPAGLEVTGASGRAQITEDWLLESTNVYYASSASEAGLFCFGWVDQLTC